MFEAFECHLTPTPTDAPTFPHSAFICLQKDLIEPAVKGTKNVLGSVAKNKSTIKRVILTSSFAGKSRCLSLSQS